MSAANTRSQYLSRWGALKNERASWMPTWQEINRYLLPETGRFLSADRNRGERRDNNIYDSEGTYALGVLAAGMMAGMNSPERQWFRLATPDPALNERHGVKVWLEAVASRMRDVFSRTNTYRALHSVYEELGGYGTAACIIVHDWQRIMHSYPLTIGQYAIATNEFDEVDTLYREFEMTVAQVVGQFVRQPDGSMDWRNVSATVKNLHDQGKLYDAWVPVLHLIEPRRERDARSAEARHMPFKSCYMEMGGEGGKLLRESGFQRFPALCPRWATSGGDIYGRSPGRVTLGDIKELQHAQWRKAQGIDYLVKPPLQAPTSLKEMDINLLPGGVSYADGPISAGIRPAWETRIDLGHLLNDINDVRRRIGRNFYVDLFLMLANDNRSNITAREIAERHEEKMLMLGPVLERLHDEMLKPLIDIAFERMMEARLVPPPPQELQGMDLKVEFVSVLAQAQRAVGTSGFDRLIGTVASVAQLKPEVLDKIDGDRFVDQYADLLGVDPQVIVANEDVALIRQQRAQQQAMLAQAQAMQQMPTNDPAAMAQGVANG